MMQYRGQASVFRSVEVTCANGKLGVSLGADQQQGCGENKCKNLFHTFFVLFFVKQRQIYALLKKKQ